MKPRYWHYWIGLLMGIALVPILRRLHLPVRFDWKGLATAYWILTVQSVFLAALLCYLWPSQGPYSLCPGHFSVSGGKNRGLQFVGTILMAYYLALGLFYFGMFPQIGAAILLLRVGLPGAAILRTLVDRWRREPLRIVLLLLYLMAVSRHFAGVRDPKKQ